jgi:outer membrane biosynthesis protein TonB
MKDVTITAATWILVAVLLAAIGLLIVTGLGRTRRSPLYRLRMSLWSAALAVAAGAGIVLGAGCAQRGGVPDGAPAAPDARGVEAAAETPASPSIPDGFAEEDAEDDAIGEATAKPDAVDGVGTKKKPRVLTKLCYAMVSSGETAEYKAAVKKVIAKNEGPIRSCYEKALQKQPDLEGRIVVKFVIRMDGTVQSAAVEKDGAGSTELAACVLSRVKMLKFPMPEGGPAIMSHPFVFKPPK